jgi:hypothetical protein
MVFPFFYFAVSVCSFWQLDDVSWGEVRVDEEDGKVPVEHHETQQNDFDPASVPLIKWSDYDNQKGIMGMHEDTTYRPLIDASMYEASADGQRMMMLQTTAATGVDDKRKWHMPVGGNAHHVRGNQTAHAMPSDEELSNEIRRILSRSDLATLTKQQIHQLLSVFFGVDLSSKTGYIDGCIDGIRSRRM